MNRPQIYIHILKFCHFFNNKNSMDSIYFVQLILIIVVSADTWNCRLLAQILIVHMNLPWWIRLQNLHYGVALWDLFVSVKLKPIEQLYNPVIPILQWIFFLSKCMSRTPIRNTRQPSTIELIIDKLTTRVTKLTLSYY